ncbi:MAG: hypothetical protein ACEY3D_02265 [Rickettsia sp.]|uniref:hypothetical protein n=1 Tax=Rickettsia sp. TaxID=789 RepID=UPI00397D1A55
MRRYGITLDCKIVSFELLDIVSECKTAAHFFISDSASAIILQPASIESTLDFFRN